MVRSITLAKALIRPHIILMNNQIIITNIIIAINIRIGRITAIIPVPVISAKVIAPIRALEISPRFIISNTRKKTMNKIMYIIPIRARPSTPKFAFILRGCPFVRKLKIIPGAIFQASGENARLIKPITTYIKSITKPAIAYEKVTNIKETIIFGSAD